MVRKPTHGSTQRGTSAEVRTEEDDWWATANSTTSHIGYWDLKPELLQTAVLYLLASGRNVGFYVVDGGRALSIYVYEGNDKRKFRAYDADELDEWCQRVIRRFPPERPRDVEPRPTELVERIARLSK